MLTTGAGIRAITRCLHGAVGHFDGGCVIVIIPVYIVDKDPFFNIFFLKRKRPVSVKSLAPFVDNTRVGHFVLNEFRCKVQHV